MSVFFPKKIPSKSLHPLCRRGRVDVYVLNSVELSLWKGEDKRRQGP